MPGIIHRFLEQTERKRTSTYLRAHFQGILYAGHDRDVVLAPVVLEPPGGRRRESMGIFCTEPETGLLATMKVSEYRARRERGHGRIGNAPLDVDA